MECIRVIDLKHFSVPYRDRIKRFSISNEQVELTVFSDDIKNI